MRTNLYISSYLRTYSKVSNTYSKITFEDRIALKYQYFPISIKSVIIKVDFLKLQSFQIWIAQKERNKNQNQNPAMISIII